MNPLTRSQIIEALRQLGLQAGDRLMVHSSLKSFGSVEGGAQTVCQALMDLITPQGTLVFPSFNHEEPYFNGEIFEVASTPTTNGAIPDAFWRMPGVLRSLNPTHSFAAWGRDAWEFTAFHHREQTMGAGSPLGRLLRDGGQILLLGVGFEPNTFHHCVETLRRVPCLGTRSEVFPMRLADGRIVNARTWGWREQECPINEPHRYDRLLFERGLVRQVSIGPSTALLVRMDDCFTVVSEVLEHGIDGFPPCSACPIRPRRLPNTVESDWDWETMALKPASESYLF